MPCAEIIAVGSELLLGETPDTNTFFLLQGFRSLGIDVYRTMIIGDNPTRISETIREAFSRADIVITTGGLGPTVDDPTRAAVALAFQCEAVYREDLWQEILEYFQQMGRNPTDNNKTQAFLPEIAEPIHNPVGTAPAFYIRKDGKLLVSLPGVPREMKYLWTSAVTPLICRCFPNLNYILMRNLHSFGIGESTIDVQTADLEASANPSLGLCAKQGRIDLRITAKGKDEQEAKALADQFEAVLRERLGNAIFGKDDDTLASVVADLLEDKRIKLRILESGGKKCFSSLLDGRFIASSDNIGPDTDAEAFLAKASADTAAVFYGVEENENSFTDVRVIVRSSAGQTEQARSYNPLTYDENDFLLFALNVLRLSLLEIPQSRNVYE